MAMTAGVSTVDESKEESSVFMPSSFPEYAEPPLQD